eukprot:6338500-Prymnesium_polylepis.1
MLSDAVPGYATRQICAKVRTPNKVCRVAPTHCAPLPLTVSHTRHAPNERRHCMRLTHGTHCIAHDDVSIPRTAIR